MNNLKIEVYSSGTTIAADAISDLQKASNIRYSTNYPSGLYGEASFFVPGNVMQQTGIKGTRRVVIRNNLETVYEGWITSIERSLQDSEEGYTVNCLGAWGYIAMRRHWRRLWADNRISEDVWKYWTGASSAELCTVDRNSRIRFTPKNVAWLNGSAAAVKYTAPSGQVVERLSFDYKLEENGAAQSWELLVARSTDDATYTVCTNADGDVIYIDSATADTSVVSASASAHMDITLYSSGSKYVQLYFKATADQTPTSDGAYYGEYSALMVYGKGESEPPSTRGDLSDKVDAQEVCQLIVEGFTDEINVDETQIGALTATLEPFIHERWTTIADIMTEAAGYGDASFNSWAVGFRLSETAATVVDGKPVLFLEQYPALTDYDYAIRFYDENEKNVVAPVSITQDFGEIYNYIIVEYQDELGVRQEIMPEDASYGNLDDPTSVAAYGGRAFVLNVGQSTAAAAYQSGQRFLAQNKDPKWIVDGPITVQGYIRKKDGSRQAASEIEAGKRLKIEDFITDVSGTGLTLLISHTEYDDESQTCSISIGPPADLIFPRFVFQRPAPEDAPPGAAGADSPSSPGEGRLNWKRQYGLVPGTPEWDEAVRLGKKAWMEKYRERTKVK